jgi:DNA-binding response OmpR family regulator
MASKQRLHVLVADDNRDTVSTLEAILRHDGHDTQGVFTGMAAVKAAQARRPHVVILDMEMPFMKGDDTAREIRAIYPDHPPLFIAISGKRTEAVDQVVARAAGFDHDLIKPCDPKVVLQLLEPVASEPGS